MTTIKSAHAMKRTARRRCMYVQRWLQAGVVQVDGQQISTDKGTPQGGVISPLLANLYLHVRFDGWMRKHHPNIPFERYADDIVVHTRSKAQAEFIKGRITVRMEECKLQLHPEKTHIVYCKDERRRENQSQTSFDFLGYTFRPRMCNTRQGWQLWYLPCMSRKAKVSVMESLKQLNVHKYKGTIQQMANLLNARIRGMDELLLPMEQVNNHMGMAGTESKADQMAQMEPQVLKETSCTLAEESI